MRHAALFGLRLAVLGLGAGALLPAASTDTATVTLAIQPIDALSVTGGETIVLDGTAGQNLLTGSSALSARLHLSHNRALPKKITAEVQPAGAPAGHDLTLTLTVAGGTGEKTLVANGAPQGAQEVLNNLAAGALSNRALTYQARGTASGTPVAATTDFVFTVTFTSTD